MKRLLDCLNLLNDRPGISTSEGQAALHNSTDWRSRMHDLKHDFGISVKDWREHGRPDKCWRLEEPLQTALTKLGGGKGSPKHRNAPEAPSWPSRSLSVFNQTPLKPRRQKIGKRLIPIKELAQKKQGVLL